MKDNKYIIVPDLHGKYYKLIEELTKYVSIKNDYILESEYKIILLGDFLDKGSHSEQKKLINFIHKNLDKLIVIHGNHEYKVYKALINEDKYPITENYDSFSLLKSNEKEKEQFMEIHVKSLRYYEDEKILCSHSPCLYQHIEKKNGYLTQYPFNKYKAEDCIIQYKEYIKNFFMEILTESNYIKTHIVGHFTLSNPLWFNNQVWLDTKNDFGILIIENNNFYFSNNVKKINCINEACNHIMNSFFS